MPLPTEDVLEIHRLLALHGHLVDGRELDRLDELFTADAEYDVSALGHGVIHGIAGFRAVTEAFLDDPRNPIGHHVTNIVVTPIDDRSARVQSKGLGVTGAGIAGSVGYDDIVVRQADGWKISHRTVTGRAREAGPSEVLELWRQAAVDQSAEGMRRVYAIDAIHEFPFTRPGLPSRLVGRDEIVTWIAAGWAAGPLRYERYRTLAAHDTGDPETIIVEQEAIGTSTATGGFALPNIVVLTARNGRIARLRDYVNVLAAAAAMGRDG